MAISTPTPTPSAPPAAPAAPAVSADDALRAGKPPVGTGSSPLFAQLIALAFVVLGVVGVQHLLVHLDAVQSRSWLVAAVDAGDGITGDSVLVLIVGVLAVALGIVLLPVVVRPRPRKGVPLTAHTGVYLRPRDVSRVAEAAVDSVDGVTGVRIKARRRAVKVVATSVVAKDRNEATIAELRRRLDTALAPLEHSPRISVSVKNEGI